MPPVLSRLLIVILFFLVYLIAGKLGLSLAFIHASASAVWPPTGIAFAFVLMLGSWIWPAIWMGAFVVNLTTAGSIATSLGIATGNTLEALLAAYWVTQFAGGRRAFDQTRNILAYVFFAVLLSTAVSATLGVTSLSLGGYASWYDYGAIWSTWWLGDMTSNLIIAPFLIVWGTRPSPPFGFKKILEFALLITATIFLSQIMFEGWLLKSKNYPLSHLSIPILLWAAFRFGQRGSTLIALLMSGIAIWGTLHQSGTFGPQKPSVSLLLLQTFMGMAALTSLVLATLLSELKDAVKKLEESKSEEKFRAVTETAPDAIIIANQNSRIIYLNKAAERIFGHVAHLLIGKSLTHLMPERFRAAHLEGVRHFLDTSESQLMGRTIELVGRRGDGSEFPLDLSLANWKSEDETFFAAIIRDITERKASEKSLHQKNVLMLLLQVVATAANQAESVEEALQICLDQICSHMGWALGHAMKVSPRGPEELISTGIWNSESSPHFQKFREATAELRFPVGQGLPGWVLEKGKPIWIQDVAAEPRFQRRTLSQAVGLQTYFAFPILVANEVVGLLEFFSDQKREADTGLLNITEHIGVQIGHVVERERAEEALRRAYNELEMRVEERTLELKKTNERLKKLDEIKTNFILAASHELRTPLTSIHGYIKLLLGDKAGPLANMQREFLTNVLTAAERMQRLLRELLNLSKIESGQVVMEMQEADIEGLLQEELPIFKAQAEEKQVLLKLEIEPGLKTLRCDPDKIREVLDNLIGNALKYTPRNGQVWVMAKKSGPWLQIDVRNTGVGIKPEDQSRIFDPFYRGSGAKEEYPEGTGLGLALVKSIVDAHRGKLSVESQAGLGSVFTVTLPLAGE